MLIPGRLLGSTAVGQERGRDRFALTRQRSHRHMASLFKDKRTGIYNLQFYDRARRPRTKRVSLRVRDKRTADRLRIEREAAYARGEWDPWAPRAEPDAEAVSLATLGGAREAFLASRAHKAANTRANYERVTGWLADHVGAQTPTASVRASHVEGWLATLDVKPVTRANYVRHLRAFFRFCVERGAAERDPTGDVRLERVPKRLPKALAPEEVERVAAYAEANCRDGEERSSAWAAPFIRLGAETAMRRNELLHLRWEHVDLESGHLTVACTDAFTSKSGAERRIPLSDRAAAVLTRLREKRPSATGYVLEAGAGPVLPDTCTQTVRRFADKAGVPGLTPHVLRHSCLTWLAQKGVPVPVIQRFAGHADVTTTMLYVSVADDVYGDQIRTALG